MTRPNLVPKEFVQRGAYSASEAAAYLNISRDSIVEAIRAGDLRAKMLGRKYLVKATDLEKWFESLPDA